MGFKDVIKDAIKIGGSLGILAISGGFLALTAYRLGYIDAYNLAESRQKQTVL